MKKLILILGVIFFSTACDPPVDTWDWSVKNNTEQTLKFRFISQMHKDSPFYGLYSTVTIPHGDSTSIYGNEGKPKKRHQMHLEDLFKFSADSYGEDVYWQILSEDDVVLKTWSYANKDLPNQRFFEESSWHYYKNPGSDALIITEHSWTFEILPEDISIE